MSMKQIHKALADMTPAQKLVVAEEVNDELHVINNSLRADNAALVRDLASSTASLTKLQKDIDKFDEDWSEKYVTMEAWKMLQAENATLTRLLTMH